MRSVVIARRLVSGIDASRDIPDVKRQAVYRVRLNFSYRSRKASRRYFASGESR